MSIRAYVHLKASLLGGPSVTALAETFKVLGDTTRVRILDVLSQTELCVQDLADVLGLTQSAVSHQLRLLRSSRLVRTRRDGRQIFYALDDDHIVGLFKQGLEHVEERVGAHPKGELRAAHIHHLPSRTRRSARMTTAT
jgi:ArsR family transcriptional regulator, lead/cadmium/zinc/bismuth-responsive transcriptional repressor